MSRFEELDVVVRNCKSCNHFGKTESMVVGQEGGVCRRNPPVPVPIMTAGPMGRQQMQVASFFPPVRGVEICGEYRGQVQ